MKSFGELDRDLGTRELFPRGAYLHLNEPGKQSSLKACDLMRGQAIREHTQIFPIASPDHEDFDSSNAEIQCNLRHEASSGQSGLPRCWTPRGACSGPRCHDGKPDEYWVQSRGALERQAMAPGFVTFADAHGDPSKRHRRELEVTRKTRRPLVRLEHKETEKLRREFFGLMLFGLRKEALDVVAELDANNLGQYEKYLPLEVIKEKNAHNNKRGITKNSSLIAGIIKIKELKGENQTLRRLLKSKGGCHCLYQNSNNDSPAELCSGLDHWMVIDSQSPTSSEICLRTPTSSADSSVQSSPRVKRRASGFD